MERKRVGIVVFDEVEVLDFCGPFEVFSATRLDEAQRRNEPSPFDVKLISETGEPITTSGGMRVVPDESFRGCPKLDILCIPGGWGTRRERNNTLLMEWLKIRAAEAELLTSVCTGAILLGSAGLLEGRRATTHWKSLDWMRELFPQTTVLDDQHVVEDGTLMTSAGISAGIDLALKVVARYHGEEVARATARHMEYPFPETNMRRVALP
ncbi:DJ-1/PfpI family protein [Geomesophilobacter sediminis]|nr:DJ-1/PfpI family protein [Geomesophilobacter sediminis]